MAASDEAKKTIQQTVRRSLEEGGPPLQQAVARLLQMPNVREIVRRVVAGEEPALVTPSKDVTEILFVIQREMRRPDKRFSISVIEEPQVLVDSMKAEVVHFSELAAKTQDSQAEQPTDGVQMTDKLNKEWDRAAFAKKLGLPTIEEALRLSDERHQKSLDPAKRKPAVFTDYGGTGWGVKIPDYD